MKKFAEELSSIMSQIEDLKLEAKAVVEAAASAGINTKALRKVSSEMLMDSSKLAKRFDDEEQIEMFRDEVGLKARKGLCLVEAAE